MAHETQSEGSKEAGLTGPPPVVSADDLRLADFEAPNYKTGPGSEFSKIQKWGDRSFI